MASASSSSGSDVIRRLTAVLAADVAGYSRLMAADEVDTLNRLRSLRTGLIEPLINRHRGQVVGSAGDSFLVAFASATDAVACAIAWQQDCARAAAAESSERQMLFRIGVHLGDVIPDQGTIYGDGVNIAARLEQLGKPGGVVVSRAVRDQIPDKPGLDFTALGPQQLKNIARPIDVFEVHVVSEPSSSPPSQIVSTSTRSTTNLGVVVLPFANMSGDKEQDYFSDGVTEDIITELSHFRELKVIARNSSFAFRGQTIGIAEIARKLAVPYVVEGSVRKSGNRLRITAQLIEAGADQHIWAERYDRELLDVFAVQDEIARSVATLCAGHVKIAAASRIKTRPTENLSAYDLVLRVRELMRHYGRQREKETLLAKAIELDPDYAIAHALMANVLNTDSNYDGDAGRRERAIEYARCAIKLDPDEPWGHGMLAYCLTFMRRLPEALNHFERAAALNPNEGHLMLLRALCLMYMGRTEEAVSEIERILERDPFANDWFWDDYCIVLVVAGRHKEALAAFDRMVTPAPWSYVFAAIAQVNLGNRGAAKQLLESCLKADPQMPPEDFIRLDPYGDLSVPERLIADLHKI